MSYSSTAEKLSLTFCLKNCVKSIHYLIQVILKDSSGFKQNFQTEEIKILDDDLNILFNKKMTCSYYFERKQELNIYLIRRIPNEKNYKKKINERITTLSSLISSPNSNYERKINDNDGYEEILSISLDKESSSKIEQNHSLFEYFKHGVKLSCFISFDFSSSPTNPTLNDTKMSYQQILKEIHMKISSYTKNHIFYSNGFGGKSKSSIQGQSIFNLNMNENDSGIATIDKVICYFNECIEKKLINSDSKITLSSVIKKLTNDIYNFYEIRFYNVSFIIIRGNVEKKDKNKIMDKIEESSYLPLTIFVIGVGKNNFLETKKLIGCSGKDKMRKNIYFISLIEDFSNNAEEMMIFCLKELNNQIIEYYNINNISPKNLRDNKLESIKRSFNLYHNSIWVEVDSEISIEDKNNIHDLDNPFKKDYYSKKSKESKNEISNDSSQKKIFKNIKPQIYENIIETKENDKSNNDKSKKNENSNKTNKNDQNIYSQKFTPTPYDSVCPEVEGNPYTDTQPEKKYFIPSTSVIDQNQIDKKYNNPYLEDYQKQSLGNMNQSNNSFGIKKINNVSGASEFNSTKNSEGIKTSNDLLYNNNYSIDEIYKK